MRRVSRSSISSAHVAKLLAALGVDEIVQPGQHGCRAQAFKRVRPQDVAILPHRGGSVDTGTDDVADGDHGSPRGDVDDVIPVVADVDSIAAGKIANGEEQVSDHGQLRRQERLLEGGCDAPLALEPADVF